MIVGVRKGVSGGVLRGCPRCVRMSEKRFEVEKRVCCREYRECKVYIPRVMDIIS